MIKVFFRLIADDRSFTKVIEVSSIPQKGNLLKAANNSFIVIENEQDLDAYAEREHEQGHFCDSVIARLNEKMYLPNEEGENPEVIEDLLKEGWKEKL